MSQIAYDIEAFNTSTESENRIHDDSVAKRFGFQGGLVPGVDVYAYMTRAAILGFGPDFLDRGRIHCRFDLPVYDGETVQVTGSDGPDMTIEVSCRGKVLATSAASMTDSPVVPKNADYPAAPVPALEDRPPASPASLVEGSALGSFIETADAAGQQSYRQDVRETCEVYADGGLVHPGFLLRRANSALKDNVLLGPWIHVGSTIQHFSALKVGETLETRARVARCYDHKGHGFVDLDVLLISGDRVIAQIDHVSIYEPRQVRQSA